MKKEYVFPKMKVVKINTKEDVMIGGGGETSMVLAKPSDSKVSEDEVAPQTTWDDEQ